MVSKFEIRRCEDEKETDADADYFHVVAFLPAPTTWQRREEEFRRRRQLRIAATRICEFAAEGVLLIAIVFALSYTLAQPTPPSPTAVPTHNHNAVTDAVSDAATDDTVAQHTCTQPMAS